MPVELVKKDLLSKVQRQTKITKSTEWQDVEKALSRGIPANDVLRVTFGKEIIQIYDGDVKKAVVAFALRLRSAYGSRFHVATAFGSEIRISNKERK